MMRVMIDNNIVIDALKPNLDFEDGAKKFSGLYGLVRSHHIFAPTV